ncbi:MAG: ABC transporter ATP-binding protein, partial [Bacteroidota bacterium]
MAEQQENQLDWDLLKRVLALAKPYRLVFLSAGILAFVLAPLSILRPFLIQKTVDDYILAFDGTGLLLMVAVLIGVLMAESILRYFFIFSTNWLGQSVIRDL